MTVASSTAVFGFGGQVAKGTLASTWYRHKALRANVGGQQVVDQFPPELGGGFHPTGAYKSMAFGAGQGILHPRLEDVIGWLLYGAVGQESQVETATPETGMSRHIFTPVSAPADMKWMSVRTYTPGATSADELGQVIKDARAVGFQFNVAAGALLSATFPFVGREPILMEEIDTGDTYAWSWANAYETGESVPLASVTTSSFKLDGSAQKALNVQVSLANAYTQPREEMIIGSPHPDDFIMRQQTLAFQWTYKWQDHALFQSIFSGANAADGSGYIAWSAVPHTGNVELILASPGNVTGLSNPYRLRIYAHEVAWQADGPPELIGGGWLSQRYSGVAQEQTALPTFQVELDNDRVGAYTWPS